MSKARKHQPDAIPLDLDLPGRDGLVVLDRLKGNKQWSHIPVIVVTLRDPEGVKQQSREYGAVGYLEKPVKADPLIATVPGVLEKKE